MYMDLKTVITSELNELRNCFVAEGFDMRLVGGAVRDLVRGDEPKDIDLCTDANPDEQIAIYQKFGFKFFETGLQHGTITVRAGDELYEITSLRTEDNHDGRHAEVTYTKDWIDDLGRRDLTFNAMSLTFDGVLIDPFNGMDDLKNNVVKFVGNPDERMKEDYLRILRWLRFHGRMAGNSPLDQDTVGAVVRQGDGLSSISRERVWMEMSKIISGPAGPFLVSNMFDDLVIFNAIDLPCGNHTRLTKVHQFTANPVTLMVAFLFNEWATDNEAVMLNMATKWKWSAEERSLAVFLAKSFRRTDFMHLLAHDNVSKAWVVELAKLNGNTEAVDTIQEAVVPIFPVKGKDLLEQGSFVAGPKMGEELTRLKTVWAESNFTFTKETLMCMVNSQ